MASYYAGKDFTNTKYACDISFENHIKEILFPDEVDLNRIIYSSDAYAFRKRAKNKTTTLDTNNLDLPFLNYRLVDYDGAVSERPTWFHNRLYTDGYYVSELEKKIKCSPVNYKYECSFWCNREDEMLYAMTQIRWDWDNQTLLESSVTIDTEDFTLPVHTFYTGLQVDPDYKEKDWLERNKIHSIKMDFQLFTWNLLPDPGSDSTWQIAENLVFDFLSQHGDDDTTSYEEAITKIINHLSETVE